MQLDLTKFLLCRAIAENADADTSSADRVGLLTSMLGKDLGTSAVLAYVIAENQAPSVAADGEGSGTTVARVRPRGRRGRRGRPAATSAKVVVPSVRHMSDPQLIQAHLHEHKLQARIDREAVPDLKTARVLRQWPEKDTAVDEGTEISVLMIVPEDGRHAESESRSPTRK